MVKETVERVDPDTGEVLEASLVKVENRGPTSVTIAGKTYDMVKRVNLPTLKHEENSVVAFTILDPIRQEVSLRRTMARVDGEMREVEEEVTINVVRVKEVTSGEDHEYVCNAMTADNLRSAYQGHTYVGRTFAVQKLGLVPGKRYKATNVIEIEPNAA